MKFKVLKGAPAKGVRPTFHLLQTGIYKLDDPAFEDQTPYVVAVNAGKEGYIWVGLDGFNWGGNDTATKMPEGFQISLTQE